MSHVRINYCKGCRRFTSWEVASPLNVRVDVDFLGESLEVNGTIRMVCPKCGTHGGEVAGYWTFPFGPKFLDDLDLSHINPEPPITIVQFDPMSWDYFIPTRAETAYNSRELVHMWGFFLTITLQYRRKDQSQSVQTWTLPCFEAARDIYNIPETS